jgi:hypothetical protein
MAVLPARISLPPQKSCLARHPKSGLTQGIECEGTPTLL